MLQAALSRTRRLFHTYPAVVVCTKFFFFWAVLAAVQGIDAIHDRVVTPLTRAIPRAAAFLMRPLTPDIQAVGASLSGGGFAVSIGDICTGLDALTVVVAAVLAFPAPLAAKGAGLLLAAVSIQAINLVRVMSLFYIGVHYPAGFETAHYIVWQAVIMVWGVGTWVVWVKWLAPGKRPSGVGSPFHAGTQVFP